MTTRYEAFTVDTPIDRAVRRYFEKSGEYPTKVIVPTDAAITDCAGLELVRSDNVSCMMLTGGVIDMPVSKKHKLVGRDKSYRPIGNRHREDEEGDDVYTFDVLRPYNQLGFYPGWSIGIEPPYWQSLRRFVFNRDGGRCANCGQAFSFKKLFAHHVVAKEAGGTDSARNIITVCEPCHNRIHDHYSQLIESGDCAPNVPMIPVDTVLDTEQGV